MNKYFTYFRIIVSQLTPEELNCLEFCNSQNKKELETTAYKSMLKLQDSKCLMTCYFNDRGVMAKTEPVNASNNTNFAGETKTLVEPFTKATVNSLLSKGIERKLSSSVNKDASLDMVNNVSGMRHVPLENRLKVGTYFMNRSNSQNQNTIPYTNLTKRVFSPARVIFKQNTKPTFDIPKAPLGISNTIKATENALSVSDQVQIETPAKYISPSVQPQKSFAIEPISSLPQPFQVSKPINFSTTLSPTSLFLSSPATPAFISPIPNQATPAIRSNKTPAPFTLPIIPVTNQTPIAFVPLPVLTKDKTQQEELRKKSENDLEDKKVNFLLKNKTELYKDLHTLDEFILDDTRPDEVYQLANGLQKQEIEEEKAKLDTELIKSVVREKHEEPSCVEREENNISDESQEQSNNNEQIDDEESLIKPFLRKTKHKHKNQRKRNRKLHEKKRTHTNNINELNVDEKEFKKTVLKSINIRKQLKDSELLFEEPKLSDYKHLDPKHIPIGVTADGAARVLVAKRKEKHGSSFLSDDFAGVLSDEKHIGFKIENNKIHKEEDYKNIDQEINDLQRGNEDIALPLTPEVAALQHATENHEIAKDAFESAHQSYENEHVSMEEHVQAEHNLMQHAMDLNAARIDLEKVENKVNEQQHIQKLEQQLAQKDHKTHAQEMAHQDMEARRIEEYAINGQHMSGNEIGLYDNSQQTYHEQIIAQQEMAKQAIDQQEYHEQTLAQQEMAGQFFDQQAYHNRTTAQDEMDRLSMHQQAYNNRAIAQKEGIANYNMDQRRVNDFTSDQENQRLEQEIEAQKYEEEMTHRDIENQAAREEANVEYSDALNTHIFSQEEPRAIDRAIDESNNSHPQYPLIDTHAIQPDIIVEGSGEILETPDGTISSHTEVVQTPHEVVDLPSIIPPLPYAPDSSRKYSYSHRSYNQNSLKDHMIYSSSLTDAIV
ncbi:hypothetical protein CDIK_0869 [Cucumispora dikerogammari]|nr:hypothetical protein CDIK_0869 [Cucumispora dikerogammari]